MLSSARASLLLLAAVAIVAVIPGCAKGGLNEKEEVGEAKSGFEMSCRLSGFSWITKQPQEGGIAQR